MALSPVTVFEISLSFFKIVLCCLSHLRKGRLAPVESKGQGPSQWWHGEERSWESDDNVVRGDVSGPQDPIRALTAWISQRELLRAAPTVQLR